MFCGEFWWCRQCRSSLCVMGQWLDTRSWSYVFSVVDATRYSDVDIASPVGLSSLYLWLWFLRGCLSPLLPISNTLSQASPGQTHYVPSLFLLTALLSAWHMWWRYVKNSGARKDGGNLSEIIFSFMDVTVHPTLAVRIMKCWRLKGASRAVDDLVAELGPFSYGMWLPLQCTCSLGGHIRIPAHLAIKLLRVERLWIEYNTNMQESWCRLSVSFPKCLRPAMLQISDFCQIQR